MAATLIAYPSSWGTFLHDNGRSDSVQTLIIKKGDYFDLSEGEWQNFFDTLLKCSNIHKVIFENVLEDLSVENLRQLRLALAQQPNLQHLEFLLESSSWSSLDHEQCREWMAMFISCKQLSTLSLHSSVKVSNISNEDEKWQLFINALSQCENLQILDLGKLNLAELTAQHWRELGASLANCTHLTTIILDQCYLGLEHDKWQAMLQSLRQAPNLQNISAKGRGNLGTIWKAMLEAFSECLTIPDLNLRGQQGEHLTASQQQAIIQALSKRLNQPTLDFSNENLEFLSKKQWHLVAQALALCPLVHTIDLSAAILNLTSEQVKELLHALSKCPNLQALTLNYNGLDLLFGPKYTALKEGLAQLTKLHTLDLMENRANPTFTVAGWQRYIMVCPHLKNVQLNVGDPLKLSQTQLEKLWQFFAQSSLENISIRRAINSIPEITVEDKKELLEKTQDIAQKYNECTLDITSRNHIQFIKKMAKAASFLSHLNVPEKSIVKKTLLSFLTPQDIGNLQQVSLKLDTTNEVKAFIQEHFEKFFTQASLEQLANIKSCCMLGEPVLFTDDINIESKEIQQFMYNIFDKKDINHLTKEKTKQHLQEIFSLRIGENHLTKFYKPYGLHQLLEKILGDKKVMQENSFDTNSLHQGQNNDFSGKSNPYKRLRKN